MKALTIVLTRRRLQRLYASNATIIKLWIATTTQSLKVLCALKKNMKGENERQLKTTPLYPNPKIAAT